MSEFLAIYKCNVCGNIVEVLHAGMGQLVCCNEEMHRLEANTVDAATEKHVPVIEKVEGGIKVKVGEVPHPMEEKHYIEWIGIQSKGKFQRQFLYPEGSSEATFKIDFDEEITALEYCNLHGLWRK